MAKKREDEPASDLAGTVEGLAAEHFEREKKAYEKRTGQVVDYDRGVPLTRTPIEPVQKEEAAAAEGEQASE